MNSLTFSFDTVTVVVPTTDPLLATRLVPSKVSTHFEPTAKPAAEWIRSYLWPVDQLEKLPSHWSPPQVSVQGSDIILQFSLPKTLYGHSARHAEDLGPVLQAWEETLASELQLPLARSWPDWRLRRVDLCYNFQMGTPDRALTAYEQLSRLRCRGRLGITKGREKLAYWPSTTRTVKFYIKGLEMKKNQKDYPEGWVSSRQFALDSILRYEEEWRGKQLVRFCRVETAAQVTVGAFLHRLARWSVYEHFAQIEKLFTVRGLAVSFEEALVKVEKFNKPAVYRRFLAQIADLGMETVRSSMKQTTFDYRCRRLRQLEIEPAMFETKFDSPWAASVDLQKWISLENFASSFDHEELQPDPLTESVRARYHATFAAISDQA